MLIDSASPPITDSAPSSTTMCAAWAIACRPELQKRLTVRPAVVTGRPARSAATRATLWPCGPWGWPQPRITSSTSAGSSPAAFRNTSPMQWAARSSGRVMLNDPRWDLASGVRLLAMMTASRMTTILLRQRCQHTRDELGEVSVRSSRARAEPHDHRVTRRNHHRVLAHVARGADRVLGHAPPLTAAIEPPQAAVTLVLVRRRRRGNELEPVVRKNPLALPQPVPEVEQSEPRPVARRTVVEAGHDEVAPRVGLEHEVARANLVEERPLRKGQVVLTLRLHGVLDDAPEREGIAVAIPVLRVGRDLLRLVDGMLEHVEAVEVDPHVLVVLGERIGSVQPKVREVETAAHAQQVAHANVAARIFLAGVPLLDRRNVVHLQLPALHDDADQGGGDALARGPADLRRVLGPAGRVTFADDLAAMHDDDRAGVVFLLRETPIESGIDAGVRLLGERVQIAHRPRLSCCGREVTRHHDRLEPDGGFAARQDGAALIAVELRHAR